MIARRFQLFEFGDQAFLPNLLRQVYHDCLGFVARICGFYDRMYVPFATWTKETGPTDVLDLASGAAGPIDTLLSRAKHHGVELPRVILSDLFPDSEQFARLEEQHGTKRLGYITEPLSAKSTDYESYPLLSICAAFHHFSPDEARDLLEQALTRGKGIFIVEPFERKVSTLLSALLIGPLLGVVSPFFCFPWRWQNFIFCTFFPIVPLMVVFDGVVSVLRSYTSDELLAMVPEQQRARLRIRFGSLPTRTRQPATFFYAVHR